MSYIDKDGFLTADPDPATQSWMDAMRAVVSLPCPGCSVDTLPTSLCEHDAYDTWPLCPGCCGAEHPRSCWHCAGSGIDHIRTGGSTAGVHGFAVATDVTQVPCGDCDGAGHYTITRDRLRVPYRKDKA